MCTCLQVEEEVAEEEEHTVAQVAQHTVAALILRKRELHNEGGLDTYTQTHKLTETGTETEIETESDVVATPHHSH